MENRLDEKTARGGGGRRLGGLRSCLLKPHGGTRRVREKMSAAAGKGSMPAPSAASGADARPSETPKDLKKRVRGLDKSLTSVHERLVQTERQIFDLERSYLEETRLYGNVLQGWDAYLDTKGKGKGRAGRGGKREASEDGEEGMHVYTTKRTYGRGEKTESRSTRANNSSCAFAKRWKRGGFCLVLLGLSRRCLLDSYKESMVFLRLKNIQISTRSDASTYVYVCKGTTKLLCRYVVHRQ